jgi:protein transport protein SEC24
MNNDVPDEYFCNLDASGRRSDIGQRPELLYGTVDFVGSKEYIMRKPKPPYLLFVIDTSRSSIQNGAFASALIAIREHIEAHLNDGNARVYQKMGIVTFDKNISIYDLRASEPQILVMSDVHEPFVPLSDGLFFDPLVACEQAFALLDRLPSLFTETRIVDSCLGAAAAFALEAMKSHGGRVVLFNTTLPNVGIGLLRNRDSAAPSGTDKVNPLVLSQGDFYSKIGTQAAALGISYVLVSTPSGFMDIATIGILVLYFTKDFRTPIQRN